MTEPQARALLAAADALPQEIGTTDAFRNGHPNCAIGHMTAPLMTPEHLAIHYAPYVVFSEAFGLSDAERMAVWVANDDAPAAIRRAAVIAAIERIIGEHGYDVAGLRKERGRDV